MIITVGSIKGSVGKSTIACNSKPGNKISKEPGMKEQKRRIKAGELDRDKTIKHTA